MRPELGASLLVLVAACAPTPQAEGPERPATEPAASTEGEVAAMAQALEARAIAALPEGDGRMPVLSSCLICHGAGIIVQQRKDAAAWTRTIRQMVTWGAPLPTPQEEMVAAYLARHFGPAPATPSGR
jgi:cytochrome c5